MALSFDGDILRHNITEQYGSVNKMIRDSDGQLSPSRRSAIHRAINGLPVDDALAVTIANLLSLPFEALSASRERVLRFTEDGYLFVMASAILREHLLETSLSKVEASCIAALLAEKLDVCGPRLDRLLYELHALGKVRKMSDESWVAARQTLPQITRLLRRRIALQWPILKEAFAADAASRARIGKRLVGLVNQARAHHADPLRFFQIDDEIHETLCLDPLDSEFVRVSRSVSWGIACDLISELRRESVCDPAKAAKSMKSISGWMLEDYSDWASRLLSKHPIDLDIRFKEFRRHVLQMRDYAQYFRVH